MMAAPAVLSRTHIHDTAPRMAARVRAAKSLRHLQLLRFSWKPLAAMCNLSLGTYKAWVILV